MACLFTHPFFSVPLAFFVLPTLPTQSSRVCVDTGDDHQHVISSIKVLENSAAARLAAKWFGEGGFTLIAKDSSKESNLIGRPTKKVKIGHNSGVAPLPPPPPPLLAPIANDNDNADQGSNAGAQVSGR